jgi:hypothetical protein
VEDDDDDVVVVVPPPPAMLLSSSSMPSMLLVGCPPFSSSLSPSWRVPNREANAGDATSIVVTLLLTTN